MQKGISPATAVIVIIVVVAIVAVVGYMRFAKKPGAAGAGGQVTDDVKAKMQQAGKVGMGQAPPMLKPTEGQPTPAPSEQPTGAPK